MSSSALPLRFVPYHELDGRPNIIVDGAATEGTVLTLSHWPQAPPPPPGLSNDLSAQMALGYLAAPHHHGPAEAVSNNHFDQDGLVSVYTLTAPDEARRLAALLTDLAAAGDFAVYRDRRAARASMALAAWADPQRSPLGTAPDEYAEWAGLLYEELIGRLPEIVEYPERFRHLWETEDAHLSASEDLVATGRVVIREHSDLDLAIVEVPADAPAFGGHRFGSQWWPGLHPMAVHNAIDAFRVLTVTGQRYEFAYRYESWVQLCSRRPQPRVDLNPLAEELNESEGEGRWVFEGVGFLTPRLYLREAEESSVDLDQFLAMLRRHLCEGPRAWDPYTPGSPRRASD